MILKIILLKSMLCMQTLIDELVLPSRKVEDFLTSITGVTAKNLEGVTLTQTAAQVWHTS